MNLPEDIKANIQTFVYFLFKGTLDPRLITPEFNYLTKLLNDPDALYNCFEIFAYTSKDHDTINVDQTVADYIVSIHKNDETSFFIRNKAKEFNMKQPLTYWSDFLVLAKWFCYNLFPRPLNETYLQDLDGCGTDAVPIFAVWTNVINIDENYKPTNSEWALKRANERIKMWEKEQPSVQFEDWELEQVIY